MSNEFVERPFENEKQEAIYTINEILMSKVDLLDSTDIEKIKKIKRLVESKRYGLVWEEHAELVDKKMETQIPIFVENKEKKIESKVNTNLYNFILEGDNLHSLHLLEKTHTNNIEIIYIDPPYNTENSLTYNDKRINSKDSYKHSKWLSFMDRRLRIAKKLLSNDGIIFISIDDNEGFNLKLLCDDIFSEQNFVGTFSVIKAEGGGQAKHIVKGHDLVLVYAKNITNMKPMGKPKDIRGKTIDIDGELYWIQEDAYRKTFGKYGNLYYEEILEYRDQEFKDEIDRKIELGEIVLVDKGEKGHILGKVRKLSDDYSKYHSVIKHLNSDGKADLSRFSLKSEFDYPKPVNMIKELITGASFARKDKITVLDFFAGSGTTGQAVLEYISEYNRNNMNFILCTNNEVSSRQKLKFVQALGYLNSYTIGVQTTDSAIENKINIELEKHNTSLKQLIIQNKKMYESYGICQSVTYPRLEKLISGFEENKPTKRILLKKKLTENLLYNSSDLMSEVDKIRELGNYSEYKIKFDKSNNVILEGINQENKWVNGISANIKYFTTSFISKDDEDIESNLLNNVKTLIELENGLDLEHSNIETVFNLDELEKVNIDKTQVVYIRQQTHAMMTNKQIDKLKNIELIDIPEKYFLKELREAGL